MSLRDVSNYKPGPAELPRWGRSVQTKPHRIFIVAGGAFIAAYTIHQAFSLLLLSLTIFGAAQVMYLAWVRLSAKTRETEELSRIHLATAEALATAIDAKDQT